MATRRGCSDASPLERKSPAGLRGSPPVLTLSHFCPRPFLCFGDVRLGASKVLPLALLNPNAEAAAVTLPRCPAAAQGFEVWPRAFDLQVGVRGPGKIASPCHPATLPGVGTRGDAARRANYRHGGGTSEDEARFFRPPWGRPGPAGVCGLR